jgi:ketosteroid isomerase-like protein
MDAGNLEGLRPFYSEDLMWFPPNKPVIKGREACLDDVRQTFKTFKTQTILTIEEMKVADSLAYVWVYYENNFTSKSKGEKIHGQGKLIYILERDFSGTWKISRVMWNHDNPPSK